MKIFVYDCRFSQLFAGVIEIMDESSVARKTSHDSLIFSENTDEKCYISVKARAFAFLKILDILIFFLCIFSFRTKYAHNTNAINSFSKDAIMAKMSPPIKMRFISVITEIYLVLAKAKQERTTPRKYCGK